MEEEESAPGPDGYTERSEREREREERREGTAPAGDAPPPPPALAWRPAQLAADLSLAKQLMLALDREKGVTTNPLAPPSAAAEGGDAQAEGGAEGGAEPAASPTEQQEQQEAQQGQQGQAAGEDSDAELPAEEAAAKLDQVCTAAG